MIKSSDLFINTDGRVYHLNLAPEEVASTIITVGDPGRVAAVSKYFDTVEVQRSNREFVTHTGTYQGKRLSVLSTGIGTDNIDIVFNELDALFNIDLSSRTIKGNLTSLDIFRIGTCGSLQGTPVDSIIVSTGAVGLDGLLHYYRFDPDNAKFNESLIDHLGPLAKPIQPYYFDGSQELIFPFLDQCTPGITATCTGFFGPQGRHLRLKLAMPDMLDTIASFEYQERKIVNFEMETAGIYGLGKLLGHRACSISAVVADRAHGQFSSQAEETMDGLIEYVLEKIAAR